MSDPPRVVVLSGGIGGSRFMRAMASALPHDRITAVINTGDDDEFHGLYVSPDPDIVTYALAGVVDEERGWGFRGESFRWLESLRRYGQDTWFQIGDQDLATHIHRTRMLRDGATLSQVMASVAAGFGVNIALLPMSDDPVRTVVETDAGPLRFQEYLVGRHAQDAVRSVRFDGAAAARPAPGVIAAIGAADAVLVAPSNPIGSIGPILSVPGIRDAIASSRAKRIAVSPIVGGRSLQPPAGEMMAGLGFPVDVVGVAAVYGGLIDTLVIDDADAALAAAVEAMNVRAVIAPTLMTGSDATASLGRRIAEEITVRR
jgi:LPPG:FO 2-phospho-L-lactate transferase